MFNATNYSGDEADGIIALTVVALLQESHQYHTIIITITSSQFLPVSARELFDCSNDTIVVTFNLGENENTVLASYLIVVNSDCARGGL